MDFNLQAEYAPTGDQPQAIEKLVSGIENGEKYQTLLGVTGSGKTFTIANVVQKIQKPTLVLAHNKTFGNGEFVIRAKRCADCGICLVYLWDW